MARMGIFLFQSWLVGWSWRAWLCVLVPCRVTRLMARTACSSRRRGREATKLRKVEGSLRHLAGSTANSGSLGKLERPLRMLPTRKSHALQCIPGRKSFTWDKRQKPKKGEESDYNVFSSSDWHWLYGAAKEQNTLLENNAKTENHWLCLVFSSFYNQ